MAKLLMTKCLLFIVLYSANMVGMHSYSSRISPRVLSRIFPMGHCLTAREFSSLPRSNSSINIDFGRMGIGGLGPKIRSMIRQALIARIIDKKILEKYSVKGARGILLHGPPGTGKSLIARNIAKLVPNAKVQLVNGPELKSKFVGETEANIRKLFASAKERPGIVHVIIFDEIDAVGRRRSNSEMSRFDDSNLTQLLTMIDGVDSVPNILVIGITNRKDVLDPALIRAGRLECHIEVSLPDEVGRREILDIYLEPLKQNNLVKNINTALWAQHLEGYSGADIEGLVERAKNLALLRNCKVEGHNIRFPSLKEDELSVVTHDDLVTAFAELNGRDPEEFRENNPALAEGIGPEAMGEMDDAKGTI